MDIAILLIIGFKTLVREIKTQRERVMGSLGREINGDYNENMESCSAIYAIYWNIHIIEMESWSAIYAI